MEPSDLDAILAEVRARVRKKRESGEYGPDLDAALTLPLPGGRPIFSEELKDPFQALPDVLGDLVAVARAGPRRLPPQSFSWFQTTLRTSLVPRY